jgi:hypothetical protein
MEDELKPTGNPNQYPELTDTDLEDAQAVKFDWYPVESLKRKVRVRSLSEYESAKFEQTQMTRSGKMNPSGVLAARRNYIALCLVDAQGNPKFKPDQLSGRIQVIEELYRICAGHNGLTEREAESLVGN